MTDVPAHLVSALDAQTAAVMAEVARSTPALVADAELRTLGTAAARALLEEFATALALDLAPDTLTVPPPLIAYARRLAQAGVPLADVLRSYRLGQELVFADLFTQLRGQPDSIELIEQVSQRSFRFVDVIVGQVTRVYEAEHESFVRGALARRQELVSALLAGRRVDVGRAEQALAYRLDGWHVAVHAWAVDPADGPEPAQSAVLALADALGSGRPLVLADGSASASGWLRVAGADALADAAAARVPAPDVRVALGEPGQGLAGFVASRRQADLARSVLRAGDSAAPVARYRDVALAALLIADRDGAVAFAREELGGLAGRAAEAESLRATLSAWLGCGSDQTRAAALLGVHRNTVAQRLARAAELLGRPPAERRRELEAALLIWETINDA